MLLVIHENLSKQVSVGFAKIWAIFKAHET